MEEAEKAFVMETGESQLGGPLLSGCHEDSRGIGITSILVGESKDAIYPLSSAYTVLYPENCPSTDPLLLDCGKDDIATWK